MIRKIITLVITSLFCASIAYAGPANCPTTENIKAQIVSAGGFSGVEVDEYGYLVYGFSNFGTPDVWFFGIGDIQASNNSDAKQQGMNLLNQLQGPLAGPTYFSDYKTWACYYTTNSGNTAITMSPIPMNKRSIQTTMIARLDK